MDKTVFPIILSGGVGSRLWPKSRVSRPKQYVDLIGPDSLFQHTLKRLSAPHFGAPIIVCNEEHRFFVAEQSRQSGITPAEILLEPFGRNTAPAVALAAMAALKQSENAVLLVCPSDHWITDDSAFLHTVDKAVASAESGNLVTFGVDPTGPNTGYGYIKAAADGISKVEQFIEKPRLEDAQRYLDSEDQYHWNSGIFVFRADLYLEELALYSPDIPVMCQRALDKGQKDLDFYRIDADSFRDCPDISIDYAVMEKTDKATVVPLQTNWSDLGVWSTVREILPQDEFGNVASGDVKLLNSRNCLAQSTERLVSVLGCDNIAVIDTADAVLVMNMDKAQEVKDLVTSLVEDDRSEVHEHRRVYRPWGDYEQIDLGNRYQVKRLVVKPGERLSLQKHHHRAEHWIVVRGTALITRGQDEFELTENQSTYIPLGELHRLENPGHIDLEIIEVQSGSYLGENDIVRYDDVYGRIPTSKEVVETAE